jgi:hypothetical protein
VSVSGAQFMRYLRGRVSAAIAQIFEIKFAYETGSGPAEGVMYFSDRQYRTLP